MANSRERNLKLVITGETADVEAKITAVRVLAKGLGVDLASSLKLADAEAEHLTSTLTFTNKEVEKLRKLRKAANVGEKGSKITSQNFEAEDARIQKEKEVRLKAAATKRLNTAKGLSRELIAIAKEEASLEKAIAFNGANSRIGIKAKAALEEKRIFRKLQKDLQTLEAQAKKGVVAGRNDKGQFISRQEAATNLQIAAQKRLNKVYLETGTQLDKLPKKLNKVSTEHTSWIRHVTEIVGLYRLVNFGINTALESIKAIPRIGIELQTTKAVLESTLGSNAASSKAFKLLDKEAERVGQSVLTLRENFRNLNASMSLAGENSSTVLSVFQDLNTITTSLHLSSAKTQDVFLAISQIFNKTKVQSEELVKQLGNLLPGAFASFARSMGLTTLQLVKKMQKGTVFATKNVQKFLKDMAKEFAAGFAIAEVGLQANIGRMQTAFVHLGETIFKGVNEPLIGMTKAVTSTANGLNDLLKNASLLSSVISGTFNLVIGTAVSLLANFLLTSEKVAAAFVAIRTATLSAAGAMTVATGAMVRLEAAMAFLLRPAVILGALTVLALGLKDVKDKGKAAVEKLQDLNKEVEKIRKKADQKLTLEVAISDDQKVIEFNSLLDAIAARLKKLKGRKDFLTSDRKSTSLLGKTQDFVLGVAKLNPATSKLNQEELKKVNKEITALVQVQRKAYENLATTRNAVGAQILAQQEKEKESQRLLNEGLKGLGKTNNSGKVLAEQAYQNSLKQTSIILQKLSGDKKQAAIAEIKLQTEITKQKFSGNTKGAENARRELDQIEKLKLAQNEIVFGIQAQAEAKAKLATAEASINASQQAGLLTQIQAFDLIQEKRKEALTAMREMINATETQAAAEATLTASQVANFDKARAALALMYLQMVEGAKRPKTEIELLAKSAKQSLERNLGNAFEGFIRGTASASEAMRNFATNILGEVARIAAQKLAMQLIGLAFKGISGAFSSGSSFGSGYDSTTGLGNTSVNYGLAKGGITSGLSKVSGTILTQPTLFPGAKVTPFASGGVLAGEAGAEAVLPLKRNSQGKLGITAELPAQTKSGGDTYNISVNVTKEKGEDASDTGNKIAIAMMRNIAKGEIANANRPGNQSNKITAFG